MGEVGLREGLSVEGYLLVIDILVLHTVGKNGEGAAVLEVEGDPREDGSPYIIIRCCRTDRVEAHACEEEPRRHLTGIVVARKAAWSIEIFCVNDVADIFLR